MGTGVHPNETVVPRQKEKRKITSNQEGGKTLEEKKTCSRKTRGRKEKHPLELGGGIRVALPKFADNCNERRKEGFLQQCKNRKEGKRSPIEDPRRNQNWGGKGF